MSQEIIKDFPLLDKKLNGKSFIYLNSAATTQKPKAVIDAVLEYYQNTNSNTHRGSDLLSQKATEAYENARKTIADFINALPEEIIFTKNTTESLNLLAHSLLPIFKPGDEVILSVMEHHSNLLPWQQLMKKGVVLKFIDINEKGQISIEEVKNLVTSKTKLISLTYASNILGTINPVKEICEFASTKGIITAIDAAQAIPHLSINVKELGCDFLAFSGHKVYGPAGIGILYGKKNLLQSMHPLLYGGGMIRDVTLETSTLAESPQKFEAGTPNVEGAVGLAAAIRYLKQKDTKKIQKQEKELKKYALERLTKIKDLVIYGPKDPAKRVSLFSFNLKGIHPHDVAEFLNTKDILVRAGHLCSQPLMKRLGVSSVVRASFGIYNTKKDVDALCKSLEECRRFFYGKH